MRTTRDRIAAAQLSYCHVRQHRADILVRICEADPFGFRPATRGTLGRHSHRHSRSRVPLTSHGCADGAEFLGRHGSAGPNHSRSTRYLRRSPAVADREETPARWTQCPWKRRLACRTGLKLEPIFHSPPTPSTTDSVSSAPCWGSGETSTGNHMIRTPRCWTFRWTPPSTTGPSSSGCACRPSATVPGRSPCPSDAQCPSDGIPTAMT